MITTFSLQSGSNGNSIYVEACGVRLLFDAGLTGKCARERMKVHGRDIRDVHALIISHDHSDHVSGAGVFHRLFGIPVHITRKTWNRIEPYAGIIRAPQYFQAGDTLEFGGGAVRVHTIPTPHDAADGVVFVVESAGRRLGIFTDLGHPFAELRRAMASVDAAYLESNYDPDLLANGGYPWELQERIRGDAGHISNGESAELAAQHTNGRLQWLALAHLSEQNNRPALALAAHREACGMGHKILVASRHETSPLLTL